MVANEKKKRERFQNFLRKEEKKEERKKLFEKSEINFSL